MKRFDRITGKEYRRAMDTVPTAETKPELGAFPEEDTKGEDDEERYDWNTPYENTCVYIRKRGCER